MAGFVRLLAWAGGLLFAAHGLVFLIFLTGAPAYPDGRLEWNGNAALDVPHAVGLGRGLTVASIGLFVAAGAAVALAPHGPWWGPTLLAAALVSLAAFWWVWPGLQPSAGTYWRGLVISVGCAALALGWMAWRRIYS